MTIQTVIAVVALIASTLASTLAILQSRRLDYLRRLPILVFAYDGSAKRWILRNIGNGPALNIVAAQHATENDELWFNPVAVPAISVGDGFVLEWLGDTGDYSLGARYCDFLDKAQESRYFTYTRDDRCSVYLPRWQPRWIMPVYSVADVRRHWEPDLPRQRA